MPSILYKFSISLIAFGISVMLFNVSEGGPICSKPRKSREKQDKNISAPSQHATSSSSRENLDKSITAPSQHETSSSSSSNTPSPSPYANLSPKNVKPTSYAIGVNFDKQYHKPLSPFQKKPSISHATNEYMAPLSMLQSYVVRVYSDNTANPPSLSTPQPYTVRFPSGSNSNHDTPAKYRPPKELVPYIVAYDRAMAAKHTSPSPSSTSQFAAPSEIQPA